MFTGIITNIGIIKTLEFGSDRDCLLEIELDKEMSRGFDIGCSIACNGICLTLVKKEGLKLSFEASKETCNVTTLSDWSIGQKVNIEFALRLGDEFGGHIVSGHVDGVVKLTKLEKVQDSWKMRFGLLECEDLMKFIAKKGSVCINGVSLTVNEVSEGGFEVNIISHTLKNTILGGLVVGSDVNLEVDLLARCVLKG